MEIKVCPHCGGEDVHKDKHGTWCGNENCRAPLEAARPQTPDECPERGIAAAEPAEQAAPPRPLLSAKYTMTFALSPDFGSILLLKKPDNHKNPLFRSNWSVPGGKIEDGEDAAVGASRELQEESCLMVPPERLRLVTRIYCNCDPTETEHEVIVYSTIVSAEELSAAKGLSEEPVQVFDSLPSNCVWHIKPLFDLVIGRMKQPAPAAIEQARPQTPDECPERGIAAAEPAPERTPPQFVVDEEEARGTWRRVGVFLTGENFTLRSNSNRVRIAVAVPEPAHKGLRRANVKCGLHGTVDVGRR